MAQDVPVELIKAPDDRSLSLLHMDELKDSISKEGLKRPIMLIRRLKESQYVIIDGYHRLMACMALGHTTIKAQVFEETNKTELAEAEGGPAGGEEEPPAGT
jgi:ParB-like chromosome segregation protein Spo0J